MFTPVGFGKGSFIGIKRLAFISSRLFVLTMLTIFTFAIPVGAEPETVLTGCLNTRSGELHNVALGLEPFMPCNPTEKQVTWSSGVPGMEGRLAALEARVEEMENAQAPLDLTVHCPQESVEDALAQAGDRTARVIITIVGVCTEQVLLERDNTILVGASPGDGLQAPSPNNIPLMIRARDVSLIQLTFSGGQHGILAGNGATFEARDLHIAGAGNGIFISQNATGTLRDSLVESNREGIWAETGAELRVYNTAIETSTNACVEVRSRAHVRLLNGTTVRSCEYGTTAREGGSIEINGATVENTGSGAFAFAGGQITISDSLIQNNVKAVGVNGGGTIFLENAVVANNQRSGVVGRAGGSIVIHDSLIEGNGGDGIDLGAGSSVGISKGTIVRDNTGHGIALGANSSATFFDDTTQVTGNAGTAVICGVIENLDDIALIVGEPGIISGNGSDVIACPRGFP